MRTHLTTAPNPPCIHSKNTTICLIKQVQIYFTRKRGAAFAAQPSGTNQKKQCFTLIDAAPSLSPLSSWSCEALPNGEKELFVTKKDCAIWHNGGGGGFTEKRSSVHTYQYATDSSL